MTEANAARFRFRVDWRVLLPLAAATVLLLTGLFLAWQAAQVARLHGSIARAETQRAVVVSALGTEVAEQRARVAQALDAASVREALGSAGEPDYAAAAAALRHALPETGEAEMFRANLKEVLDGDLKALGYAKAAALMRAKVHPEMPPAEMRLDAKRTQRLMFAQPARVDGVVRAYAVVELPFASVLDQFQASANGVTGLQLRQGDGRGDLLIEGIGSTSAESPLDLGVPVPGSSLRIGVAEPDYFIITPRRFGLLAALALVCLLAGGAALWLRKVGVQRATSILRRAPKTEIEEITLAQAIQNNPEPVENPVVQKPVPVAVDPSKVDASMFRAYDIRGVVGGGLSAEVARLIGRAIGSEARDRGLREIVVGRDGRLSGPDLVGGLIEGLRSTGMDVIDIGLAPTPVTYFACYHLHTGSGISVTGSHNPPDYNGFKIVLGGETLSEGAIQDLYRRIVEGRFVDGMGGLQAIDVGQDYVTRITDDVQTERRLKIVVDSGNGVAGALAPAVLEGIGCEVVPLYCDVDGTFPNHHPDPSDLHNLEDLIAVVRHEKADLGIAFDGDGDRLGVVTPSGEVIFPDRLLMLFAIDILTRNPGATIIYDVKCTGHLQPLILQHGGSPLMWRTGHSLIKAKMRETEAAMAGEMSGHFFFGERWYGFDDGIYSAARLLEILASDLDGRSPQQIFDTVPKGVSTPELKIPMREGEHYRFIEQFREKSRFDGARLTTIDGVRADWPDGWGLVRASNTTPVLVLRFDADNAAALERIQNLFRAQLKALDPGLSMPF